MHLLDELDCWAVVRPKLTARRLFLCTPQAKRSTNSIIRSKVIVKAKVAILGTHQVLSRAVTRTSDDYVSPLLHYLLEQRTCTFERVPLCALTYTARELNTAVRVTI